MDVSDQVMYAGCWVVLTLYVVTTLTVFIRQSCIRCAVAFLFACILWLDLSLFNAWFFLPAFMHHIWEIDLHADNALGFFGAVFTSEAARDVYLMVLGSLGSWLAVFNAAGMLKSEGFTPMNPQEHGKLSKYLIKSAYRLCDYLDFGDHDIIILPITNTTHTYSEKPHPQEKHISFFH
ncbi:hypothetical protein F5X98DRAFT_371427 [Xylaria grammica]|nr:hypothetical protein F5X98DRAFT_371427 [Xylaria grammica]